MPRLDVPAGNATTIETFIRHVAEELCAADVLAHDGLVLRFGDLELVMGDVGSAVFSDPQVVDDITLHMGPLVYERLDYVVPEMRWPVIAGLTAGTGLLRVVHTLPDGERRPLYSVNMVPFRNSGRWRGVDERQPSAIAPTFEFMSIAAGQQITLRGRNLTLDDLDLGSVKIYELSRLASMLEMVMGRHTVTERAPEPTMDRFRGMIAAYQADAGTFIQKMLVGRGLFGIGIALYAMTRQAELIFGNFTPGVVDRFIQALGVDTQRSPIQTLTIGHMHRESEVYQTVSTYFESHTVTPFMLETEQEWHVIANGCAVLAEAMALPMAG
jgi:hypothetical protein